MLLKDDDFYETPPDLFASLNRSFGPFDLDVCAEHHTAKCLEYFCLAEGEEDRKSVV